MLVEVGRARFKVQLFNELQHPHLSVDVLCLFCHFLKKKHNIDDLHRFEIDLWAAPQLSLQEALLLQRNRATRYVS